MTKTINLAQTAKFLKELYERKEIEGKVSGQFRLIHFPSHLLTIPSVGKQIVYHAVQSAPDEPSTADDLTALEHKITTLRSAPTSAKTTEKNL